MICPKCGFEQEERLDCKECGIVFSKYNALFPSPDTSDSPDADAQIKSEFQELQAQVRELSSHLIDTEFEKAERKKLRSDVKDQEEQIHLNQIQMETRFRQLEERLEQYNMESKADILGNLPNREEVELKTSQISDTLDSTTNQLNSLWEKTGQNSFQINEIRAQFIALRTDFLACKEQLKALQESLEEEPKTILEDDVKAIRKNLDELGHFISGLGRNQYTDR